MKTMFLYAFVAAYLLLADGKSLGANSYNHYEIEREETGLKLFKPKYDTKERLDYDQLKQQAEEQFNKLKEFSKMFGFDIDNLKSMAEEKMDKLKAYAKTMGLDFDAMKEEWKDQLNKLKEKAKEQGFDVDELKEKAKLQLDKLMGKAKRLDVEAIKNWAKNKYDEIKREGSKIMGREDSEAFDKLKKRAKSAFKRFISKILD